MPRSIEPARRRDEGRASGRASALPAVVLFAGGLLLRLAHLAWVRGGPFFEHLYLDPLYYDEWGRRIAAGDLLGDAVFFQDPAYPYFLGSVYALAGHRHLVVLAVQALLGSLVAPMVFLAARPWLGRAAALVAGALAAAYLPSVYYEGIVLKTWMGAFLVAAVLLVLSRTVGRDAPRSWLLAGVAFGVACLARGNLLLVLPVVTGWVVLDPSATGREPRKKGARSGPAPWLDRRALRAAACLVLGAGVVLAVTAVRNRVVAGWWVLTTANAGQNFYIGNNPFNTTGRYEVPAFVDSNPKHEQRDFQREADRRSGRPVPPDRVSSFWFGEALDWIASEPGAWLVLMGKKVRAYFGAYEVPDNLDFYLYREYSPALRLPLPGYGVVAPLTLFGAILLIRRPGWPRLVLLYVAAYSASVVLFFVFSRFRMAAMPAMFALAGHAAAEIPRSIRRWREGSVPPYRLAAGAAVLALLFAFVNLPVGAPESVWTVRWARAAGLPVRIETTAAAHANLGLALAQRAKDEGESRDLLVTAERELRESARQEPAIAKFHAEHGKVLARLGRDREAIEAFERAAGLEPGNWRTHHTLGLLHRREGDLPGAAAAFGRAVRLNPRDGLGWIELGEVLLDAGRPGEARAAFRRALELSPSDARARRGLARAGGP